MQNNGTLRHAIWPSVLGGLVLLGLYLSSRNDLLFHSLAEIFSIVVSFSVFLFALNTINFVRDDFLIVLGAAYLAVGFFDLMHTLAYKGMNVFAIDGANASTQLWIIARYIEGLSLLFVTFLFGRRVNHYLLFAFYFCLSVLLLQSVFVFDDFPKCFAEDVGLTEFKIISEFIICAVLAAAGFRLYRRRNEADPLMTRLLLASIGFSIAAELAFTSYADVYDWVNKVGHLLKIVSVYLVYRSIIAHGLRRPYKSMFRELSESKERLESRVAERTRQLEERNLELRKLSGQLLTAEERERNRIARDLHDSIGQSLSAIKFFVEGAVAGLSDRLNSRDREMLERIVPMVKAAIDDVRRIIRNLRPSIVNDLGLVAGIRWLCRDFGAVYTDIDIERHLELGEHELPEEIKDPAFRFLQEALNNIGKHSRARSVSVLLGHRDGRICIEVSDDGIGFDAGAVLQAKSRGSGFGLGGMRERAELSGGEFAIDSRPGQGTRVIASWPSEGGEAGQDDGRRVSAG